MNIPSATFATYNILNPFHAVKWAERDGLNETALSLPADALKQSTQSSDINEWRQYSNWDERCTLVSNNIALASIVCLQEVSPEAVSTLNNIKPGYLLANAVYHASSRPCETFGNAIVFDSEKVRLIRHFEVKFCPNEWTRSAACAVFEISGRVVMVASVHLGGYNPREPDLEKKQKSKVSGFKELDFYVNAIELDSKGVDAIVIGGDFNEDPAEEDFEFYRIGYLKERGYQFDGNMEVTETLKNRRIDWLCYKPLTDRGAGTLSAMNLEKVQQKASDHLMTGLSFQWSH